jgi:hypothetical protein
MSDFKTGDRVVVLRLDSDEIECHGCYQGEAGPIMFVLPDDDDLLEPVEVGADRVLPEKSHRRAHLAELSLASSNWRLGGGLPCVLAPLCRRRGQGRQAPGWHLSQPEHRRTTWRLSSGRSFLTTGVQYLV